MKLARIIAASVGAVLAFSSLAAEPAARPGAKDKCPVCGMFVSRYPDWTASVTFGDGSRAWFDGAKDLFKFLADPAAFLPGRKASDVRSITVSDYYALRPLDAREAFYVVGSDVTGPMGRELVPFATRAEAQDFLRDHRGKQVLRFAEVNRSVLAGLE